MLERLENPVLLDGQPLVSDNASGADHQQERPCDDHAQVSHLRDDRTHGILRDYTPAIPVFGMKR